MLAKQAKQGQGRLMKIDSMPNGPLRVPSAAQKHTNCKKNKIGLLVASFVRAATQKSPQTLKIEACPNGPFRVPSAAQKNTRIAKNRAPGGVFC